MMKKKNNSSVFLLYIIAILITTFAFYLNYRGVDFARPLNYDGDAVSAAYLMKTIKDTGWFLWNPFVGGKYIGNFADYAMSDNLSMLIVKVIALFTDNIYIVYNSFFYLTFVLVTVTCLYALLQLGVTKIIAIVFSVLYAFLPYHQMRLSHIWLTPYFMVPLVLMVCILLVSDDYEFSSMSKIQRIRGYCTDRKIRNFYVIMFFSAFTGFYYAFFTCCTLAIVLVINALKSKKERDLLMPFCMIMTVAFGVIINVFPSLLYWIQNGVNTESELAIRLSAESEIYALKLIQLILPSGNHRVPLFRHIAEKYNSTYPLVNENMTATLGIIGSIGLILLLIDVFKTKNTSKIIRGIVLLNLATILIATMGGVGAIFSFIVDTPMRCYNRLSIYIGFYCITYLAIFLSGKVSTYFIKKPRVYIYYIVSFFILLFGLYDQTSTYTKEQQINSSEEFENDKIFVQKIETILPEGSMVYQMPHICFPSGGTYELFKGYMHSQELVWSFGGMQGRDQDKWEHYLEGLSLEEMVIKISLGGYSGIYLDKSVFEFKGQNFEEVLQRLKTILNSTPIYSEDGTLVFFDMIDYNKKIASKYTEGEYLELKKEVYNFISAEYINGFSTKELNDQGDTWYWCNKAGTIKVYSSNANTDFKFKAIAMSGYKNVSNLKVSVNDTEKNFKINSDGTSLEMNLNLNKGVNLIQFETDASRVYAPSDERALYFRLNNIVFHESKDK